MMPIAARRRDAVAATRGLIGLMQRNAGCSTCSLDDRAGGGPAAVGDGFHVGDRPGSEYVVAMLWRPVVALASLSRRMPAGRSDPKSA